MELSFKLNEFEGPMDLLLHLISKHKLNIFEIEIIELVDQYTNYIETVKKTDPDVAGEFIEMAARLVYIKTVMLLPRHEEEKQELKAELTGQLVEYQACKQAAVKLNEQNIMGDVFTFKGEDVDYKQEYNHSHNISVLFSAYLNAIGKGKRFLPPAENVFSPIVKKKFVSVSSKIIYMLKMLYKNPKLAFMSLFEENPERSEIVATFLAVLELVKANRISITENQTYIVFNSKMKG